MRFWLLIFCWFLIGGLYAQPPKKVDSVKISKSQKVVKLDSSQIVLRSFDEQQLAQYKTHKEFQYGESEASLSWWQRAWMAFWRWIDSLFASDGRAKPSLWNVILKCTLIATCIAVILLVIFKMAKVDWKLLVGKSEEVAYDETIENIHEINFEDELAQAMQNRNYRLAVRLLYLQTLKHLSDKEIIDWQPNKTNLAYVAEVQNGQGYEEFTPLTHQFEYVWYGDFKLDKSTYEHIQLAFQQFNNRLK